MPHPVESSGNVAQVTTNCFSSTCSKNPRKKQNIMPVSPFIGAPFKTYAEPNQRVQRWQRVQGLQRVSQDPTAPAMGLMLATGPSLTANPSFATGRSFAMDQEQVPRKLYVLACWVTCWIVKMYLLLYLGSILQCNVFGLWTRYNLRNHNNAKTNLNIQSKILTNENNLNILQEGLTFRHSGNKDWTPRQSISQTV